MTTFRIPDKRSTDPDDYTHEYRLRRLKQSWDIGVEKRNQEELTFEEGFTWGSIGKSSDISWAKLPRPIRMNCGSNC